MMMRKKKTYSFESTLSLFCVGTVGCNILGSLSREGGISKNNIGGITIDKRVVNSESANRIFLKRE